MSTPKQGGDDLLREKGGRRGGAGRTTVGEARRRRRGAAGLEVGVGGRAASAGGVRSAHAQQGHDTQRRREGRSPRAHSRAAAPGAAGRGGLSASQAGPRAGPGSDGRRRWRRPAAPRSLANCWAHFNSNPTKTLTNSNPKKSAKWRKTNRLEWRSYLQGSVSLCFPLRIGWRIEWI